MRFALINPRWTFDGSIYFGCREPHLPLEYGYARALLEAAGHSVVLIDGQLENLPLDEIRERVVDFRPDFTVITTAPSYLFWRCAPPEVRVPQETLAAIRPHGGRIVIVGPHASTTPAATRRKLAADFVLKGECEELLPKLAAGITEDGLHASDMTALPALEWPAETLKRHTHHHHRFDTAGAGPGAEMETSRGCPYHCTFCAKDNFRNTFRRRPLTVVAQELDDLIAKGVEYVYLIDEIFLPYRDVLCLLKDRSIKFGVQTRIDLWKPEMIDLLGEAGCVSVEAGVESITESGRDHLDKRCRLSTDEIASLLIHAKQRIAFVQANLLESKDDRPEDIRQWREHLISHGVWANEPVPLFPYPGSPEYTRRWGAADDLAWERAHAHYLNDFSSFSDIQEQTPMPLVQLERA